MKKANILYTSHTAEFKFGGQISLFNLVKGLNRDEYRPFLLCPSKGELDLKFHKIGCHIIHFQFREIRSINIPGMLLCIISTIRLLRRYKIDLIHSDHPRDTCYLGICSRLLNIPLIWHTRVTYSSRLDSINLHLAKKVIGVSKAVSERFIVGGKTSKKHITIYNGVDCDKFNPLKGSDLRKELKFGTDEKIIAFIGQITPDKGIEDFLEASRYVVKKIEACKFLVIGVGDNIFVKRLKQRIDGYGLIDHVIFLGFRTDMANILNGVDIVALPSRPYVEGLPRVVIEAMACGKPVIGTDVQGINEAVKKNVTGLLVPPKDPVRLSRAILEILSNEERSEVMGRAGRKRAERMFSIIQHIHRIEDLYREILSGRYTS